MSKQGSDITNGSCATSVKLAFFVVLLPQKRPTALRRHSRALGADMDGSLVKQTLEIEGLKIIREYPSDENLMSYPQEILNRNVSAFNGAGDLVWTIQEAPHGGEGQDKAYMLISIENGCLVAGNFIGVDYLVNLQDGTVTPKDRNVRPW